jgi:FMN phosphatase YigB (HAD superfamily)
MPFDGVTELLL